MPDYNAVQIDRVENLTRRLLGVRNGGILPTVAPELSVDLGVPALEDVLPLAGYIRFGVCAEVGAVAAQIAWCCVANLTSRQLFGVSLQAGATAATQFWLLGSLVQAGGLLAADRANWLDFRRTRVSLPLNSTGIQVTTGNTVNAPPGLGVALNAMAELYCPANTSIKFPTVILPPGTACTVAQNTVNAGMIVSGECWLRDIIPDELVI